MPTFDSDGVSIHYEVFGDGLPLVLVHGFASSLDGNWVRSGWIETLTPLRRVIALDCRGHGESGKPHDPEAYAMSKMAGDVLRLMDHLRVGRADLMGYSMGARISLYLIARHGERFGSVVLGGIGGHFGRNRGAIAAGLRTDDPARITDARARGFRAFAEANKQNDLEALAACMSAPREPPTPEQIAAIAQRVLIVTGAKDTLVGSPEELAAAIPGARAVIVPDRDHLTTVPDRRYKEAVVAFLNERVQG